MNQWITLSRCSDWLLWAGRLGAAASLSLLGWFVVAHLIEGSLNPNVQEALGLLLFPGCVMLGLLLALWRPMLGGVLVITALAGFYLWNLVESGRFPTGPYFLLFSLPGLLLFLVGLQRRWAARQRPQQHSSITT